MSADLIRTLAFLFVLTIAVIQTFRVISLQRAVSDMRLELDELRVRLRLYTQRLTR